MGAGAADDRMLRAAVMAHARGDLTEAARLYRLVIQARGEVFEALHNLGHVLVQQGRAPEAADCFERALAKNPDAAQTHNMLAQALRQLGRYGEAVVHYRRALALRPAYPQAHHDLGRLLQALGRLEEARGSIETAIAQAPARGEYYRSLSEVVAFENGDPHLAAMEALSADPSLAPIDQIELRFALGKAYADLGRSEPSFRLFAEGCGLMRSQVDYDEAATLAMFDQMAAVFTADLLRAKTGLGEPSAAPIFILGMPRSGSTLVEQILASHPKVTAGGEMTAFRDTAQAALGDPAAVRDLGGDGLRSLGARYLDQVRAAHPEGGRVTDKMPANFLFLGLIRLALPNARIIHTMRDPVDTCLSCFTTLFADGQLYSYNLGELGRHYRAYQTLMDHWRTVLPPGGMLEVRYEDLIADQEGQTRRLLDYCDLAWDDACFDFHKTSRAVWTASAAQVRRPLYSSAVGRRRPTATVLAPLTDGLSGKG
jgi:tetratricopeptide (TPR) repeat protein